MKNPVRILILSFIFYLSSFIFAPSSFAQTNPYTTPNTSPDVPKNMHTWTQNVVIEVLSALTCQITGIDPVNPNQKCLGADPKTGQIGFVENGGGAIGMMGSMIAVLYTPPLHTGDYFNYLAQNFGVAKPAHAALGFDRLSPLIGLWTTFRNLVYLVFVIVFIFIGLAIMLRIKIDPRTVMSIENQIPKMIIGILLVTFSFAIAGFLIDLMYVFIYLIFNIFGSMTFLTKDAAESITKVQTSFNGDNVIGVFNNSLHYQDVVTKSSGAVKDIVGSLFGPQNLEIHNPQAFSLGRFVPALQLFEFIQSGGGDFVLKALGTFTGWVMGFLALFVIGIAVLWSLFKLWFELIKAYVFILIDVVLAPFYIVSGVFPGGLGVGGWLRDIISNLIVFPTTIVLFLLGKVFMEALENKPEVFVPPLIGNPGSSGAISSLIGFGIIMLAPQVVNMMKEYIKAPQFKYISAIGQAVGVGAGVPGGTAKLGARSVSAGLINPVTGATGPFSFPRVFSSLFSR